MEPSMVGDHLRRARKDWQRRTGKRLDELVAEIRITRPTIFLRESSKGNVDPVEIRRMLEFYGVLEREILAVLDLRSRPARHLASDESGTPAPGGAIAPDETESKLGTVTAASGLTEDERETVHDAVTPVPGLA